MLPGQGDILRALPCTSLGSVPLLDARPPQCLDRQLRASAAEQEHPIVMSHTVAGIHASPVGMHKHL